MVCADSSVFQDPPSLDAEQPEECARQAAAVQQDSKSTRTHTHPRSAVMHNGTTGDVNGAAGPSRQGRGREANEQSEGAEEQGGKRPLRKDSQGCNKQNLMGTWLRKKCKGAPREHFRAGLSLGSSITGPLPVVSSGPRECVKVSTPSCP